MKKIIIGVLLLISLCFGLSGAVNSAYAGELDTKDYLVNPKYSSSAANYGIEDAEIKSINRPFDENIKYMAEGQNFTPAVDSKNQFDKTINTNKVSVNGNLSLFIYVFFSEVYAHNLSITLADQTNSIAWVISGAELETQIVSATPSYKMRYGWVLIELPFSVATSTGALTSVETMNIKYSGDKNQSARLSFYAPYLSSRQNDTISYVEKQNFYNFSIKYGFDLNSLCAGDKITIANLNNVFEYCIIGDVDCLSIGIPQAYKFVFSIIDAAGTALENYNLKTQMPISYTFDKSGAYSLRVTLFSNDNQAIWKNPDVSVEVHDFVAVYLAYGIADIQQGTKIQTDISVGRFTEHVSSIQVESSNKKIADASVQNGKLVVEGKKAGKASIKLIVVASRDGQQFETYEYEYSVKVVKDATTSVLGLIFGGIGLLIAGVIVYTIMVRRRLIAGKYPKY